MPDGGVQLEWAAGAVELEVEIEPGAAVGVFVCDDRDAGHQIDGELPRDEGLFRIALERLAAYAWQSQSTTRTRYCAESPTGPRSGPSALTARRGRRAREAHSEDGGLSVDVRRLLDDPTDPTSVLNGLSGFGLAEFEAAVPRTNGLEVEHTPLSENHAHADIRGFEAMSKKDAKRAQKALAEAAAWIQTQQTRQHFRQHLAGKPGLSRSYAVPLKRPRTPDYQGKHPRTGRTWADP